MSYPIKRLFVILSLVMTFVTVQAAWSGIVDVGEVITITGTVYNCEPGASGIQIDTADGIITVYGMGPASYWVSQGVEFPEVGENVTINAYEITFSDGAIKLVADSVDLDSDGIVDIDLRDDDGTPLWRQNTTGLSQSTNRR